MPDQPNVVVFFTDQQRFDASGLFGNPLDLMLNFDRLAHRGTHLWNHFTCAPVCGPARSCLQTGTYISRNGTVHNNLGLPDDLPTVADCFNDAGYHTGYIGKWHLAGEHRFDLGDEVGPVPEVARGGYREWLGSEALEFTSHEYQTTLYDNDNQPVELPGYRSDAMVDAGVRFLQQHRDRPFMLTLSFIEPHHQNDKDDYPPPDGYREKYAGRWTPPDLAALPSLDNESSVVGGSAQRHLGGYWGMIKRLDEGLGRIYDALRSLRLLDNTIILFTSDHGCHFRTRNCEYKRSCHDASIRLPTMLYGGPFTGGRTLEHMTSLVDLPPTLLDACGIDVPDTMQGRSVMPLLRGNDADWPQDVLVQVCDDRVGRAVRTPRWKYCVMSDRDARDVGTDFAGVTYREAFLYDMHHDPHELQNLIHSQPHDQVRHRMRQRLIDRMAAIGETEPTIETVTTEPNLLGVHDDEIEQ
jgi:arylsulfatase A-like enzyme